MDLQNKTFTKIVLVLLLMAVSAAVFYFVFSFFSFGSGSKDKSSRGENYKFFIKEIYPNDATKPLFELSVFTARSFPCDGFKLHGKLSVVGSNIVASIGDISSTGFCWQAFSAASFSSNLDVPNGLYTLTFESGWFRKDIYKLRISETDVAILPVRAKFTDFFSGTEFAQKNAELAASGKMFTVARRLPMNNLLSARCHFSGQSEFFVEDGFCERFFADVAAVATIDSDMLKNKTPENLYYTYDGETATLFDILKKYTGAPYEVSFETGKGLRLRCTPDCKITHFAGAIDKSIQYSKFWNYTTTDPTLCDNNFDCLFDTVVNVRTSTLCAQLAKSLPCPTAGECNEDSINFASDCYMNFAIKTGEVALCEKGRASIQRETCYEAAAVRHKNPAICTDNFPPIRYHGAGVVDCYETYAKYTQDARVCELITEDKSKKWCLKMIR